MRILFLFSVLFLFSCSVDELPPCDGEGQIGEICKEYQYVNGRFNGSNSYEYNSNGDVSRIITSKKNGSEEGTALYSYDSLNRCVLISLQDPNGKILSEKIFEFEDDLLVSETVIGQQNSNIEFFYDAEDKLMAEKYSNNSGENYIDSLEYFVGVNKLYRKIRYKGSGVEHIVYYEEFSNDMTVERLVNSNGVLQERTVRYFNGSELKEELVYNNENLLIQKTGYHYYQGELEVILKYNESGTEFERLEYQRY